MTMTAPISFIWEGDGFKPASPFWQRNADEAFVVGEHYKMVEHHERSAKSHNHYFASIANAWQTLPEQFLETYPTAEHLRKKALIWKGYRDERTLVASSATEALRIAAFVRPADDFAVVTVKDAVVRIWTAKSQKIKAMGNRDFQQSKSDVLDFIDDLLGVERGSTGKAAV